MKNKSTQTWSALVITFYKRSADSSEPLPHRGALGCGRHYSQGGAVRVVLVCWLAHVSFCGSSSDAGLVRVVGGLPQLEGPIGLHAAELRRVLKGHRERNNNNNKRVYIEVWSLHASYSCIMWCREEWQVVHIIHMPLTRSIVQIALKLFCIGGEAELFAHQPLGCHEKKATLARPAWVWEHRAPLGSGHTHGRGWTSNY